MIAVDANIIIYYCTAGPFQEAALRLWRGDRSWHAPELWRSEILNFLAGQMRRALDLENAVRAYADAQACVATTHAADGRRVLELASSSQCTAYDLQYVALAQQLRVPLVTMDGELLRAFPDVARPLVA